MIIIILTFLDQLVAMSCEMKKDERKWSKRYDQRAIIFKTLNHHIL